MARLLPICSSSKGNSVFVGDSRSGVLVDAGCSFKALRDGLNLGGIPFDAVKLIVVTHEHSDHIKALMQITKNTELPIYASKGTMNEMLRCGHILDNGNLHDCSELSSAPTDIEINWFHTPHDSAESVGYTFSWSEHKIACCTDLGYVTKEVKDNIIGSDTVYIEANYEPYLLRTNPKYPTFLKERIASHTGHLSNNDSADFCAELVKSGARNIILGHLSQENNTPSDALKAVSQKLLSNGMKTNIDYTLNVAPVMNTGKYIIV
ncbi:MAG: MBL fold metallo-hydrolase [Ruminiclostridium sp.]|nr:MBL fold metallo-hydrolase [Ruminiclostridium sp.]